MFRKKEGVVLYLSITSFKFEDLFVLIIIFMILLLFFLCFFSPGKAVLASKGVPRQVIFVLNRSDIFKTLFIALFLSFVV